VQRRIRHPIAEVVVKTILRQRRIGLQFKRSSSGRYFFVGKEAALLTAAKAGFKGGECPVRS
jgi:hypothetical protein